MGSQVEEEKVQAKVKWVMVVLEQGEESWGWGNEEEMKLEIHFDLGLEVDLHYLVLKENLEE